MKIKFLTDYAGRETAMREHVRGAVVDTPTAQALELIRLGVAIEYTAPKGKEAKHDKNPS